jgi:putative Ca2+/H+ antiporter (TMEM165/GDT1 family)
MEAFLVSAGVVALAEFGDKTQLLTLLLAARFRRPLPILAGIVVATLVNHALAGLAGLWLGAFIEGPWFRWIVGGSFLAIAAWTLIPDKMTGDRALPAPRYGVFVATLVPFFLVEIGDKTQIATVALAARFDTLPPVVIGTTLGLCLTSLPALFLGNLAGERLKVPWVRYIAAAAFALLGVLVLLNVSLGI